MEEGGKINVYRCRECNGEIVTVNLDEGVTPMFLKCRAKASWQVPCSGTMVSACYNVPQDRIPTHAWFRPNLKQLERMDPAMRQHCEQGGLDFRKLDNIERERYGHRTRHG